MADIIPVVQTAEETRNAISSNIASLRVANKLTQAELAEKLSYSDKAISKWERGDSLPEICVLKQISQMFDVSLDWLTTPHKPEDSAPPKKPKVSRSMSVTLLSVAAVWLVVVTAFTSAWCVGHIYWQLFVAAVPCTCVALFVCNILWGNHLYGTIITSVFSWSTLTSIFVFLLKRKLWMLFILGIPLQFCILFIYGILARTGKGAKKLQKEEKTDN